jgi:hypothetical protein
MRTFLLMIASALCGIVLFVAAAYGYLMWQARDLKPGAEIHIPHRSEKTVAAAPEIPEVERFFGSHAMTIGNFPSGGRTTVLAAGPGRLIGMVTSSGRPLEGLRLRLALNGSVMSQWAATKADGRYEVSVPYGKYRIDGYELDSSDVHKRLAGKTDGPGKFSWAQETVLVDPDKTGRALNLDFVDPVRKIGPRGDIKPGEPVVVTWNPYPGAAAYRVQISEQKDPGEHDTHRDLFEWRHRPLVSGTSLDLAEHKIALKKGYYYVVHVEALDERNREISSSPRQFRAVDFRVPD